MLILIATDRSVGEFWSFIWSDSRIKNVMNVLAIYVQKITDGTRANDLSVRITASSIAYWRIDRCEVSKWDYNPLYLLIWDFFGIRRQL